MLSRSTITLLRIPFSYFLMPVYFFALSQVQEINGWKAALVFVILHFIMYPASNGYNSYMDRDEGSIGLLEKPPPASRELYHLTLWLDALAIALSFCVSILFAACIIANILASRAYSYRGIRLKKYPVIGFLTVILFQGAITYLMVYAGSSKRFDELPVAGMVISSFLFGGFYPLTQIYQHEQDRRDGVVTISAWLGYRGTFIFSALMYLIAEILLYRYFTASGAINQFWLLQFFFVPIVLFFLYWWWKVEQSVTNASFRFCMRMNLIAATATNAAFILLNVLNHRGGHLF